MKILKPVNLQLGISMYAPPIFPQPVPIYRPPPPIPIMAPALVAVPSSEEKTTTTKKPKKKKFKIVYSVFPPLSCNLKNKKNKSNSVYALPVLPSMVAPPPLVLVPVPPAIPVRTLQRRRRRKILVFSSEESTDSSNSS
ncbi:unnamed protein product [Euphydryas editha]|uniref:Uncharacterized protein n=1 Tax=Euphydryas editha TaxID=104508 RepID=A0AAU9TGZ7_EUPED|nr:unnamed protein product [Euphydryas editha]